MVKKILIKSLLIMLIVMITPKLVSATEVVNKCTGDNSYDCAFCVYNYTSSNGCNIKFSVTYKSDSTPLEYTVYEKLARKGTYSCDYNYNNFLKDSFVESGTLKCPNVKANVKNVVPHNGRVDQTVTLSSNSSGDVTSTSESAIKKATSGGESTSEPAQTYSCYYKDGACGDYSISIIDGKAKVILNSSTANVISQNVDASLFKDNYCPSVFSSHVRRDGDTCIFTTTSSSGYKKSVGSIKNENTGEITENPGNLEPTDCESLLGDPETSGTPAFYLVVVFNVIKYVAIILLIVLSIIDFISAIASSDQDIIRKTAQKVLSRAIMCVVIFLLPTLLKVFLSYLSERAIDLCGIGG